MNLSLLRITIKDLSDSFIWYEEQERGLGDRFILAIEESFEVIKRNPFIFPIVKNDVRRKLVRKFPYIIYYYMYSENIIIIGVLHSKRNPDELRSRIS